MFFFCLRDVFQSKKPQLASAAAKVLRLDGSARWTWQFSLEQKNRQLVPFGLCFVFFSL